MVNKSENKSEKIGNLLLSTGAFFLLSGMLLFTAVYFPVLKEEAKYSISQVNSKEAKEVNLDKVMLAQLSKDYQNAIYIPKIQAQAPIVLNVDPFNYNEYIQALYKGVAHARGTSLPGNSGNSFIFAHSSDNFYNANRYNAVFYLLRKLEAGDSVYTISNGDVSEYKVQELRFVEAQAVEYIEDSPSLSADTLTLMTCWPPGTDERRLLVFANKLD